jgi:hypothetical protein
LVDRSSNLNTLTHIEARRIAVNIAKLPLCRKGRRPAQKD